MDTVITCLAICFYTVALVWFSYNAGYNRAVSEINGVFEDDEEGD